MLIFILLLAFQEGRSTHASGPVAPKPTQYKTVQIPGRRLSTCAVAWLLAVAGPAWRLMSRGLGRGILLMDLLPPPLPVRIWRPMMHLVGEILNGRSQYLKGCQKVQNTKSLKELLRCILNCDSSCMREAFALALAVFFSNCNCTSSSRHWICSPSPPFFFWQLTLCSVQADAQMRRFECQLWVRADAATSNVQHSPLSFAVYDQWALYLVRLWAQLGLWLRLGWAPHDIFSAHCTYADYL